MGYRIELVAYRTWDILRSNFELPGVGVSGAAQWASFATNSQLPQAAAAVIASTRAGTSDK